MTTLNSKCHNQKRHPCLYNAERFFRMPEKCYINICNMGSRDLPDMSALALGRCAPRARAYISGKSLLPMLHI